MHYTQGHVWVFGAFSALVTFVVTIAMTLLIQWFRRGWSLDAYRGKLGNLVHSCLICRQNFTLASFKQSPRVYGVLAASPYAKRLGKECLVAIADENRMVDIYTLNVSDNALEPLILKAIREYACINKLQVCGSTPPEYESGPMPEKLIQVQLMDPVEDIKEFGVESFKEMVYWGSADFTTRLTINEAGELGVDLLALKAGRESFTDYFLEFMKKNNFKLTGLGGNRYKVHGDLTIAYKMIVEKASSVAIEKMDITFEKEGNPVASG